MIRQYKSRFSLIVAWRYNTNTCISILSFPSSTNLVKDVEIIYRKTLISTAKNNIEIAQSQLLELTSPHN